MARWISTGGGVNHWGSPVRELVPNQEDSLNDVWIDLDSGCKVLLASDGGWRNAHKSAFKAFHKSPQGVVTDVTYALLKDVNRHYRPERDDVSTYEIPQGECRHAINEALGVTPRDLPKTGEPSFGGLGRFRARRARS